MKLNPDQEYAFGRLRAFYSDPNKRVIVIRGPGGTGKTHITASFVNQHPRLVGKVVLTAPTNKAVEVLNLFSKKFGGYTQCMTVFSLLGLVLGDNGEVKRTFQATEGKFDDFDTILIDEGSMAGSQLCDVIDDRLAENPNSKIIVMGDPCQLNPVHEYESRLLSCGEIVELTIDMRSGNGPLLQKKRAIRDLVLARNAGNKSKQLQVKFETELDADDSGVHFLAGKHFDDAMLDMFDSEEYRNDNTFCRALSWTNKEVDRLNRIIRTRIYGKGCAPYMVNEIVAVLNPVWDGNCCVFGTDAEVKILAIEEAEYTDYSDQDDGDNTYKVYKISLQEGDKAPFVVPVIHPESERKFRRKCDSLAEDCRSKRKPWKSFWSFHDTFVRIRPVHAMTVHKSQGQTFSCTFVNLKDVMGNKDPVERARLGYVAMSRSTTDLVVNLKTFY